MKRGLALEGGGARGAYHIGVYKAFVESGYDFNGYVGTSIGAINAAVLAQGDFEKALELWMNISPDQIFAPEEQPLLQLADIVNTGLNADIVSGVRGALSKVITGGGISTEKMLEFLNNYLDEDKIRASGKDFGLVTVSLSERRPYELMLDDIPEGKLVDYIMASASFPGFSAATINGNKYIDGGFYNNCPVNLLDALGYEEIIAVRVGSPGIVHRRINTMKSVKLISPSQNLGRLMQFSSDSSAANIRLGYFDGIKFIQKRRNY